MQPFANLVFDNPNDMELFASLLAHFAFMLDQNLDEYEAFEIIEEFLTDNEINLASIDFLAKLVRTAKFNPERHILN